MPAIGRIDTGALRASVDLVDYIESFIPLKRGSRGEKTARCPFHDEKTPSFTASKAKQFYHCFAGDTRVITSDGTRAIGELSGSEHKILTTGGVWTSALFSSYGVAPLRRVELTRNGVNKEVFATSGHRWFVRSLGEATTDGLHKGDRLACVYPQPTNIDLDPSGVCHGVAFGDGTMDRPTFDVPDSYLTGFLAGYITTNGHVADDGTVCLNCKDEASLSWVRDTCHKLGIGTYGVTTQSRFGCGAYPSGIHRIHLLRPAIQPRFILKPSMRERFVASSHLQARQWWVVQGVSETNRIEEVFCASVPGTHAFALEDNILTGNCFGCGAHGDVIDFAMQYQGLQFREAAIDVARFSGFELPTDDGLQEAEVLKSRREAIARKMEAAMAIHVGVLALSTIPGAKPRPKDIKPRLAAVRVVRKGLAAMFDVGGPRATKDCPYDGNIHAELTGLWRGFLNRTTERHHGRTIRAVRPEAGTFPLIPFEREVLAARRVLDWLTEAYPSDHEQQRKRR